MTQVVYNINQANAVEGSLGEFDRHWVRSYVNGTSVKKRYTISVDVAADEELSLTLTSPAGVATVVSYNEGAAGTVTTKRNGLIAAINASAARFYCRASVKDSDELYIESTVAGQDFTAATAEANLTLTNDVAHVASPVIGFGLAVAQGAQDGECKALSAVTDKVIGVALFSHADNPNDGVAGYKAQSAVSVLRRGVVVVRVEEAVSAEDPVFVRAVATGTEKAGAFRKSVDSTDCIAMPGCKFLTSASAGGLAFVSIEAGQPPATAVAPIGVTAPLAFGAPAASVIGAAFNEAEVEAALLLKADQADAEAFATAVEARLDAIEAKVDALISALKSAGLMN